MQRCRAVAGGYTVARVTVRGELLLKLANVSAQRRNPPRAHRFKHVLRFKFTNVRFCHWIETNLILYQRSPPDTVGTCLQFIEDLRHLLTKALITKFSLNPGTSG